MTARRASIEADQFYPHPPAAVWRALTDPERLGRWLAPNDFEPRVGHDFTFDMGRWGLTHCTVLECREPELLRYSWRSGSLDTEIVWRLAPEGRGTRLFLEHRGFDLDDAAARRAHDGMSGGWASSVLPALGRHLVEDVA